MCAISCYIGSRCNGTRLNKTPLILQYWVMIILSKNTPDSKVHGDNMGPIWGRHDQCWPHVGPMNFAIWDNNPLCLDTLQKYSAIKSGANRWENCNYDVYLTLAIHHPFQPSIYSEVGHEEDHWTKKSLSISTGIIQFNANYYFVEWVNPCVNLPVALLHTTCYLLFLNDCRRYDPWFLLFTQQERQRL